MPSKKSLTTKPPDAPTTILGWHFISPDGTIAHPGSLHAGTVVTVGQTLEVPPPIKPCRHGLHASVRILDALGYASSPLVCRVELSGEIVAHENDKHAASRRRVLAMANITQTLHIFACDVAEEALLSERAHNREPDARSWAAIETKRAWLRGEASDSELQAARAAAEAAAWSAAEAAAEAAARAAAEAAAEAAQNERLTALVLALPEFAALQEAEVPA